MVMDVELTEGLIDKALTDLRLYDLAIDLHGSRALGIHQPNSNVDVLITRPLQGLLNELEKEAPEQSKFNHIGTVPTGPPWYLPQKLRLSHLATGVELQLISRWSADIFVRERDAFTKACFNQDERVQPYLELVLKWAKRRSDFMPVDQGYPSVYCFRLFALHFLMVRMHGAVLPPLTRFGSSIDVNNEGYARKQKAETKFPSDDLAVEFLEHLGKLSKPDQGLCANLRNLEESGLPGEMQVVDPPSHKKLLKLSSFQVREIAKIAKMDAKALRNNKGALDKPLKSPIKEA